MALVQCPECHQKTSEQAGQCPHCGMILRKPVTLIKRKGGIYEAIGTSMIIVGIIMAIFIEMPIIDGFFKILAIVGFIIFVVGRFL